MNASMPNTTAVHNKTVEIDGLKIFYREAGEASLPKLLLLHGFPASSHQYRNLLPSLSGRFHVIAPDYPGFGNSDMPDPREFSYTFARISEIIESFLKTVGFTRFACGRARKLRSMFQLSGLMSSGLACPCV